MVRSANTGRVAKPTASRISSGHAQSESLSSGAVSVEPQPSLLSDGSRNACGQRHLRTQGVSTTVYAEIVTDELVMVVVVANKLLKRVGWVAHGEVQFVGSQVSLEALFGSSGNAIECNNGTGRKTRRASILPASLSNNGMGC